MYDIDKSARIHNKGKHSVQLAALAKLLDDSEINLICRQLGHTWPGIL